MMSVLESPRFGIIKVSREAEGVKFISSTLSEEEEKYVLLNVVKGNPVGEYTRMETDGEKIFLQTLKGDTNQSNISVTLAHASEIPDALVFLRSVNDYLEVHEIEFDLVPEPNLDQVLQDLAQFDGLEGLLFTIFTSIKLILLGDEAQNRAMILNCLSLIPPEIAKYQRFHTFSEHLDKGLNWIGMPPTTSSTAQLGGLEYSHSFVSIPKSNVVSPYTCDLLRSLAGMIYNNQFDEAIELIHGIYQTSIRIKGKEDPAEVADIIESSINDAEFLIRVSKNHELPEISHPTKWRN